jgi:hypothetical protein
LLSLVALLLVADVGVRRVRLSGTEIRAGYATLRRKLGYVDDREGNRARSFIAPVARGAGTVPTVGLVSRSASARNAGDSQGAPPGPTQSGRLLAAKRRASRR